MDELENRSYFFDNGIRFECTQCGNCCTGTPGLVRFNSSESREIATFLGIDESNFVETFTRQHAGAATLREQENGDCIFFKDNRCSIHPVKPRQCATYPFWVNNLRSKQAWKRTCDECPGIGLGRLYSKEEIFGQMSVD